MPRLTKEEHNFTMKAVNNGLGIFGGSFDPIHLGHTQSAQSVADELGLSKVHIIPAYISPLKSTASMLPQANTQQRCDMVKIACQQNTLFYSDPRELKRAGPSYTVDTLKELKAQYPQQTLHFIIGMDSLISFTRWHKYQEILKLCHLVVNTRPHHEITQLDTKTQALLNKHLATDKSQLLNVSFGKIYLAKPISYDISSTEIRERITQQQSYQSLLHPKIVEYIDKNQLYR